MMFGHLPALNQLRAFEAAARLQSFKLAAAELHVTPTAISHQIRHLEEMLGVQLFKRRIRAVSLTEAGDHLAQASYQSLQHLASAIEEITTEETYLVISTTAAFAAMWLVPRLDQFHKQYPKIQVILQTSEVAENLGKEKQIDLAIRYGPTRSLSENCVHIIQDCMGIYATPLYLERVEKRQIADFIATKWKNGKLPSLHWRDYVEDSLEISEVKTYDQEHHVIQAALAGQGLALISTLLVSTALCHGWLVPYRENISQPTAFSYYIVMPPHKKISTKVAHFTDWILQELSNSDCLEAQ